MGRVYIFLIIEIGLIGSLAFMRNKQYGVETIKRFINLDSISSEGFEMFSRASPSSISLEYKVPRPHSNVIGGILIINQRGI
jgi:hypothetical protein